MKNLGLLFLFLIIFSSCTKKDERWAVYKDPKYPLVVKYPAKKMRVEPFLNKTEKRYALDVIVDIGEEFPDREVTDENLYRAIIQEQKYFKNFPRAIYETSYEEVDFNGTPAIASKDQKGRIRTYILLVPKVYAYVWLAGVDTRFHNPNDITQKESDRVEQLTYEMIKHFKWEKPVDTTSEEFKAWKTHIWEILKKGGA